MKAFLLFIIFGLLAILFMLVSEDKPTPVRVVLPPPSIPNSQVISPKKPLKMVEGKCKHDGINETLMQAASGRRELKRFEIIGLKKLLAVKEGYHKTDLKKGIIQLNSSLYVVNYCPQYFEEVKDYLPDGAKVPAHLSR